MENPNNRMIAAGRLTAAPQLSHEVMNEPFYSAILQVKRLSGALDSIPLTLPGKLLVEGGAYTGKMGASAWNNIGSMTIRDGTILNGVVQDSSEQTAEE